jgi:hypothetical protein
VEFIAHPTHPEKLIGIAFYWNNQKTAINTVTEAPYDCDVTEALKDLLMNWRRGPFDFSGMSPTGGLAVGEHQFKAVATYEGGEQAVTMITINVLPSNQYRRRTSL